MINFFIKYWKISFLLPITLFGTVFSIKKFILKYNKRQINNLANISNSNVNINQVGRMSNSKIENHISTVMPEFTHRDILGYIENSNWIKKELENKETWICEKNNLVKIESGEHPYTRDFVEPWTKCHPDETSSRYKVKIMHQGTSIDELDFVSVDGGRIFVPITEQKLENGATVYLWDRNKVYFKVARIISDLYRFVSLEDFARFSNIKIIN